MKRYLALLLLLTALLCGCSNLNYISKQDTTEPRWQEMTPKPERGTPSDTIPPEKQGSTSD